MRRFTAVLVALSSCLATFAMLTAAPAAALNTGGITTLAGGSGPGTAFGTAFAPSDLAVVGNKIYVADPASHVVRAFDKTTKTFSVVAGNVSDGPAIPGPATSSPLEYPSNIVAGPGGALYVSSGNQVVKITGSTLSVVAGTGDPGDTGDGGPATAARLYRTAGLALGLDGSLFIVVNGNEKVRKVAPNGIITTVAGTGEAGFSGDGGPATAAKLSHAGSIERDSLGNLYLVANSRIRKIAPNGIITTVAGTGSPGDTGDGGPATSAQISAWDIAVDPQNNVLIATGVHTAVRKIVPGGIITTIAAGNGYGHEGDGGPAIDAKLSGGRSVVIDPAGGYVIGDSAGPGRNNWLRAVTAGGIISSIAGTTDESVSGDGGPSTAAQMGAPTDLVVDPAGNAYVADPTNNRVRKIAPDGKISAFAGKGWFGYAGDGGPALEATFYAPTGLALDKDGNVYVVDTTMAVVRRITPAGIISTVAGTGDKGYSGDGGPATAAMLRSPEGVTVDPAGNLYIADTGNSRVRKVTPGGTITTVAGTGEHGYSGDGGVATAAKLNRPSGVAVDRNSYLLIADTNNHRIRRVGNGIISTIAGTGAVESAAGDSGPAIQANLWGPRRVTVDRDGSLFISESANNRIRKVDPAGKVSTVAGSSTTQRFAGDGGAATAASLNQPRATGVRPNGDLLIADTDNLRIRRVPGVAYTSTRFHSVTPFRALDSRTAVGNFNGPVGPGAANVKTLAVAGAGGGKVPANATAVVMNVTVTEGTANSFLTVYPAGGAVPTASNLNFAAGQTIPNLVTVGLSPDGLVSFFNALGSVHVVADVVGYFDSGLEPDGVGFVGMTPARILDSKTTLGGFNGPLLAGVGKDLTVTNVAGVPVLATTVVLNITVSKPTTGSYLTVYPAGAPKPTSSNVNFGPNQTISNLVTAKVGASSKVTMVNQLGSVHVTADVVGYYMVGLPTTNGRFHPLPPTRILDDRNGTGGYSTPWGPNTTRTVAVGGAFGIPLTARGVVVNLTATNGTAASSLVVWPDGVAKPDTTALSFEQGQTIPDLDMVKIGTGGKIAIHNRFGSVDVIADVVGYYADI